MGIDTTKQRDIAEEKVSPARVDNTDEAVETEEERPPRRPLFNWSGFVAGFQHLEWGKVLFFGIASGLLMPFLFTQPTLSIFAGIIPVGAGLLIGRRVKGYYGFQGFMTGVVGAIVALGLFASLLFATSFDQNLGLSTPEGADISPMGILIQLGGFTAFSLITFCWVGAAMSGRTEERNRALRRQVEERGGQLERPGAIRDVDDIRGLSLPQFGTYVNNVFKKNGFQFKDYRFVDKDKHLDLWMEHNEQPWHLRLTVADKISSGTIEGLYQEMKRENCSKGVVVTSTEFLSSAVKSAKGRPIVLINGTTLYEIAEN